MSFANRRAGVSELLRLRERRAAHRGLQLLPKGEDVRRVLVRELPRLRQRERTTNALEDLLAERILERMDLRADRGLRQPQHLRRARDRAFASDRPEVEEVVVVQPRHPVCIQDTKVFSRIPLPNYRLVRTPAPAQSRYRRWAGANVPARCPHREDQAMGRLVKFNVVDEAGTAAPGQTIMVGDNEIKTSSTGIAQALLDDGETAILVNGVEVYRGAVAALRPIEIFTTRGQ